jgi:hypothetical protein
LFPTPDSEPNMEEGKKCLLCDLHWGKHPICPRCGMDHRNEKKRRVNLQRIKQESRQLKSREKKVAESREKKVAEEKKFALGELHHVWHTVFPEAFKKPQEEEPPPPPPPKEESPPPSTPPHEEICGVCKNPTYFGESFSQRSLEFLARNFVVPPLLTRC